MPKTNKAASSLNILMFLKLSIASLDDKPINNSIVNNHCKILRFSQISTKAKVENATPPAAHAYLHVSVA